MNTNSKHYETLNIQPWEIMERNFTTEEFVAYLKGNIIKYTLRNKGQALTDAEKIKHYAEKLIEVIEKKETDEFLKEDAERIYGYGEPEPVEEPEDKPMIVKDSKFKVGDRVRLKATYLKGRKGTIIRQPVLGLRVVDEENYIIELDKGDEEEEKGWTATKEENLVDSEHAWYVDDDEIELLKDTEVKHKFKVGDRVRVLEEEYKGTIIRTPTEKYAYKDSYLICLDEGYLGWTANKDTEGIDAENVWQVRESGIELLKEEPKKTLKPNKWYDAEDFTVEELKELLPIGTKVTVVNCNDNDRIVSPERERTVHTKITNIGRRYINHETRVGVKTYCIWKRYFKIAEEN